MVRFVLPAWAYVLAGVAAVIAALVPWIRTGMAIPLQDLWSRPSAPAEAPSMFLPLNQYYLMTLAGLVLTAGAIGGLVARGAPPEHRRRSGDLSALGLVLALAGCAVQSGLAYSSMRPKSDGVAVSLVLLLVWVVLCSAGAVVLLLLLARSTRAGASVASAIAAPAVGVWVSALTAPELVSSTAVVSSGDLRWLPAVLVGLALAWCGLRTGGRVAAWAMSLVLLWVVPAVLMAIGAAASSQGSPGVMDRIGAGLDVLGYALRPELALPGLILAAAVGLVGTIILLLVERFRPARVTTTVRPSATSAARARPVTSVH